ncbi:YfcC family protein [Jeotgalicoccus halotolerans]|uniref:Putative ion transporter superfamily protein YfcC n=1 Tax=Jeotgalicoccus halotolerans TaxID=157227 RepID=A0A3E0ARL4_9STAP|nr:Na+/H+ antiporter NhaC family protein [Jeotgalicoccus halotolerans]REG20840.1 putative ion transporter superfamily protein YfcC [Jeotgalicoccus halotolerans]
MGEDTKTKGKSSKDISQKFPHTYAILLFIVILGAALSYIIPAGEYERVEVEDRVEVIGGSFHSVEQNPVSFMDLIMAIPTGLNEAADIIFYIFLIGGAFGVIRKTGALEAIIQKVMNNVQKNELLVIPIIMTVFSILGFTTGMSEEAIIFVPIGIMLSVALGYDALVGTAMVTLGAAAGFIGGMFNPFTVGIAHGIAELPIFSGWAFRLAVYFVVLLIGILFVMSYAKKVKKNPKSSLVYEESQTGQLNFTEDALVLTELRKRHIVIIVLFALTIAINVYGIFVHGWFLTELAANFFIVGIIIGFVGGLKLNTVFDAFIDGMKIVVYGAIIVGFARAILVVLESGLIIDTIIYSLSAVLDNVPTALTAIGMLGVQVIINFFIPSGSGQAMTTMPIMVPISDLQGISRQVAVLAYQYGDAITNSIIPTSASLMGVLAVAGIPYIKWVKFVWKLIIIWLIIAAIALVIATLINLQ